MKLKTIRYAYVVIFLLSFLLLVFGLFQIQELFVADNKSEEDLNIESPTASSSEQQSSTNETNSNDFLKVKSLRDATMTYCTFAIGLFAIIFEVGKKDKYGNSLKQENHFELIYIKRRLKTSSEKSPEFRRSLPIRFLIPYFAYIASVLASAFTSIWGDAHPWAVCLAFIIFVISIAFMSCYMVYILSMMYGQDWIVSIVQSICKDAFEQMNEQNIDIDRVQLACRAIRIMAESGSSCPQDIINAHKATLPSTEANSAKADSAKATSAILLEFLMKSDNQAYTFAAIDYYKSIIVSYYYSAIGSCDVANITDELFAYTIGSKATSYPNFAIAGIAACRELNELLCIDTAWYKGKLIRDVERSDIERSTDLITRKLSALYDTAADPNSTLIGDIYDKYAVISRGMKITVGGDGKATECDATIRKTAEEYFKRGGNIHAK